MPNLSPGPGHDKDPSTGDWIIYMLIFLTLLGVAVFFMGLIDYKP